ncbi:MAG: hypothetical protein ACHQ15_00900 [Candidatus Limnocylindrales bacterium]
MRRSLVGPLCSAVAALLLAACGAISATMPPPTPADALGIFAQWALRGIDVHGRVSGDPGCGDASLVDNAVHVVVSLGGDADRDVYLFSFSNSVRWADGGPVVDACQAQFEARSSRAGGPVERIDVSPYRAFGDGWSAELKADLSAGLVVAAGDGGVPTGADANLTPQPSAVTSP